MWVVHWVHVCVCTTCLCAAASDCVWLRARACRSCFRHARSSDVSEALGSGVPANSWSIALVVRCVLVEVILVISDEEVMTALLLAAQAGGVVVVKLLIEFGADVDAQNVSRAARRGCGTMTC